MRSPSDQEFEFVLAGIPAADTVAALPTIDTVSVATETSGDLKSNDSTAAAITIPGTVEPIASNADNDEDVRKMSYWQTFLAGFGYGLIALLMPCVWPVIPLTISYFLKQHKNKRQGRMNAFLYGFSIILIL